MLVELSKNHYLDELRSTSLNSVIVFTFKLKTNVQKWVVGGNEDYLTKGQDYI